MMNQKKAVRRKKEMNKTSNCGRITSAKCIQAEMNSVEFSSLYTKNKLAQPKNE